MAKTAEKKIVEIPGSLAVRDLATVLGISPVELMKALIANGIMASITESVDFETAAIVAEDLGFDLRLEGAAERAAETAAEIARFEADLAAEVDAADAGPGTPWYLVDEPEDRLVARPPVVTMMGHVDHGKTSLLDAVRKTNVTAGESGGITQHIGAYTIDHNGQAVTFIDTPGHEAFTAMRARGAQATDIAVIVVAADDGVMPTTVEAIDHAKAAHVAMVVAVNKIDLPEARADRVMEQLSNIGVVPDAWGGDTFFVPTSAESGQGLDELLDAILLVAEEIAPKGNPKRLARGTVLEGKIDPARGVIATVLVQTGTLKQGDMLVVGNESGRVRALFDHTGKAIKSAGPSTPVEIMGLPAVPDAGARFEAVDGPKAARALITEREDTAQRQGGVAEERLPLTLESLFARVTAGEVKSLNLIVKTDVQGTVQPVVDSLEKLSTSEVKVEVLHASAGDIGESDIHLAVASHAVVIGFRVSPDARARRAAAANNIEIREYDVIYKLVEDVESVLTGMLDPIYEERVLGRAEVRAIFTIPKVGRIAGCAVTEGLIRRNASARVLRGGAVVGSGTVASLKRFQDDAREVREGFECGIGVDGVPRMEIGDVVEAFVRERVR